VAAAGIESFARACFAVTLLFTTETQGHREEQFYFSRDAGLEAAEKLIIFATDSVQTLIHLRAVTAALEELRHAKSGFFRSL
jgi:hypothetical protein